jgi:plasmid maintenance system antidote protein VapI
MSAFDPKELHEALEVGTLVARLVSGESTMTLNDAERLAKTFGLRAAFLVGLGSSAHSILDGQARSSPAETAE